MLRFLLIAVIGLLAAGCSHHHHPDPIYEDDWVGVNVTHHSVDVRVRPGTDEGNVDVHTDWP